MADDDTVLAFKMFEQRRRETIQAALSRNDVYWNELKHIHRGGLDDLAVVTHIIDDVRDSLTALASALTPKKGRRSSSSSSGSGSSGTGSGTGSSWSSSLDVGKRGRALMDEHHTALASAFQEEAKFVDTTLAKHFAQQQNGIEHQLAYVNFKGDRLMFSMKLADARARHFFDMFNRPPPPGNSGSDLWLLEARYAVAAARSYEVRDEVDHQLGSLFALSKDVEARRQQLVFGTLEKVAVRHGSLFPPALAARTVERVKKAQRESGDGEGLAAVLASRVEQDHADVAVSMMQRAKERAREREKQRLLQQAGDSKEGDAGGAGAAIPMAALFVESEGRDAPLALPFPMHSPQLRNAAIFAKKTATVLKTTWTPVLLCLTAAGIVHVFDLDADTDREPGTVAAFSNAAQRSRKGLELELLAAAELPAAAPTAPPAAAAAATAAAVAAAGKGKKDGGATAYDHLAVQTALETEDFMQPAASLVLSRCTVTYAPANKDDLTFDLVEATPLSGVSSIFRKNTVRTLTLRAPDQHVLIEWMLLVEAKGEK